MQLVQLAQDTETVWMTEPEKVNHMPVSYEVFLMKADSCQGCGLNFIDMCEYMRSLMTLSATAHNRVRLSLSGTVSSTFHVATHFYFYFRQTGR